MAKKKNILVITYWSYRDALIQTYTLPYVKIIANKIPPGSKIYLLTLEQGGHALKGDEINKVQKELSEYNIELIAKPYFNFGIRAMINWVFILAHLWYLILTQRISYLHSFCTDAAAAGCLLNVVTGVPLIVDSYEPHAEPMLESGTWTRNSKAFKILFWFEKWQTKLGKAHIACVESMKEYAERTYGATPKQMYVKPACIDFDLFSKDHLKDPKLLKELGFEDKVVLLYAGKFGGSYLEQEVFDFFKVTFDHYGDKLRILLLSNQSDESIETWCANAGLDSSIIIKKFVMHQEVPKYMGLADFAITPFIPVPSKRYGTPIKTGEYWAMGLPVVITRDISDDSDIIEKENIGAVIDLNTDSYQKAVLKIDDLLTNTDPETRYQKINAVARKYRSFEIADSVYTSLYSD